MKLSFEEQEMSIAFVARRHFWLTRLPVAADDYDLAAVRWRAESAAQRFQ
jgi:hypothetical protein